MEKIRISECIAPAFHAVHRDVRRHGHGEYWLSGGRGSAKSSFVSLEIVLGLMRNPGANAIVYRKVAATLRESVYEQMIWAIERLGLERYFHYRLSPLEIDRIATGQRILFRGADDPGKSKSIKLAKGYFGYVWFEELAEFGGMDDVRTIRASLIRGEADQRPLTFCTYNPPRSRRHWVNAEALIPKADRLSHSSTYLEVPRCWLGEDFIAEAEALRRSNERAYRHMYLGEVAGSGGQVFENLVLRPLTGDELCADRAYSGLDFGFAVDPDAFVRIGYDPRSTRLWVLDEFHSVRTPTAALAEALQKRAQGEIIRCDGADPRMIHELRASGLQTVAAKKGAGSVATGIRWLQERAEIAVDPSRCPHTARELASYEYPMAPGGEYLPEFPDRDNHHIDALRYAAEPLIRTNPARTNAADLRKCIMG